MILPIIFSGQLEPPAPGEDLNLGEIYQFILGPEWGKTIMQDTDHEGIGSSHLDGE